MRVALVCLLLCACADVHLGDEYGKRTKATFQAQADAAGGSDSMLDAEDVKMILSRHRNKEGRAAPAGGAALLVGPTPTSYGSGGGSMSSGGGSVVAPIKLDSTR
jgi:hypothetical protein